MQLCSTSTLVLGLQVLVLIWRVPLCCLELLVSLMQLCTFELVRPAQASARRTLADLSYPGRRSL